MILQPAISNIADHFTWKVTTEIASNSPVNNANKATAQLQILPDSFFCLMAWRGSTNYDNVAGEFITDDIAVALYAPARVPSNFDVSVKRASVYNLMPIPMPQAAIASSGYAAGAMLPWPILYAPSTTFYFEFYNTAPVVLTEADQNTAIPLRIDFGMFGYNIPANNIAAFLKSWPAITHIFERYPDPKQALSAMSAMNFNNVVPGVT
jgi:hypothetical protein